MEIARAVELTADTRVRSQGARPRRRLETTFWYIVLISISVVTVLPFAWMLLTSLKGPQDPIFSVPPQFIPAHPTLANYDKVLHTLPIVSFFRNSIVVAVSVTLLSVLVSALEAYPLSKMRFKG
jgi:putative chitobiose transport system permease protein